MSAPGRVHDGALLRATLFRTDGPARGLFVSFRQRLAQPGGFSVPAPVRSFTARGFDHLHVQSRRNDWFVNSETPALEAALDRITAEYPTVVAMGFSMGGYGALRLSRALRLRRVVLVSPQFSIAPGVVPFDRRYRAEGAGFDALAGDLNRHAARGLGGYLLFDPMHAADHGNARLIASVFLRLELCRLAFGGHPATQVLRAGGHFAALQRGLRDDRLSRNGIIGWHRAGRRGAPVYWQQMAQRAQVRGNPALAAAAAARLVALAGNESLDATGRAP